jgi:hypothetical protein
MTIYYSPSTAGFYDTGVVEYPTLPEDCIEITQEERDLYIEEINHKNNQLVVEDEKLVLKLKEEIVTWETVRLKRNGLLNASDYTQVPDFPGNKEAWAAYRQQLRDIPQMFVNPEDVDWPFVPNN